MPCSYRVALWKQERFLLPGEIPSPHLAFVRAAGTKVIVQPAHFIGIPPLPT